MGQTESMKEKALNKIEAKMKFLLLEIRSLQDEPNTPLSLIHI